MSTPPDHKTPRKAPPAHAAKPDSAFDKWLNRGLHQLYDEVAREPVPEELLRLIEQDRHKNPPAPDPRRPTPDPRPLNTDN